MLQLVLPQVWRWLVGWRDVQAGSLGVHSAAASKALRSLPTSFSLLRWMFHQPDTIAVGPRLILSRTLPLLL
jgi:hypothetical protein